VVEAERVLTKKRCEFKTKLPRTLFVAPFKAWNKNCGKFLAFAWAVCNLSNRRMASC
jgi:hypothetical protein